MARAMARLSGVLATINHKKTVDFQYLPTRNFYQACDICHDEGYIMPIATRRTTGFPHLQSIGGRCSA